MYGVVEDITSIRSIIVKSFVHNIPSIALPLVVRYFVLDVILYHGNKGGVCPRSRGNCAALVLDFPNS